MKISVFISQPMNGYTDEEIVNVRKSAVENIKNIFGNDVIILDSFFCDEDTPLCKLGRSIQMLDKADIVYFCKGWDKTRGCVIEFSCAKEYGKKIFIE